VADVLSNHSCGIDNDYRVPLGAAELLERHDLHRQRFSPVIEARQGPAHWGDPLAARTATLAPDRVPTCNAGDSAEYDGAPGDHAFAGTTFDDGSARRFDDHSRDAECRGAPHARQHDATGSRQREATVTAPGDRTRLGGHVPGDHEGDSQAASGHQVRLRRGVMSLEGAVMNGGFHQFFANSSGNCAQRTQAALKETAGFTEWATLFRRALDKFPAGRPAEDRAKRGDQMEAMRDEFAAWTDVEDLFYKLESSELATMPGETSASRDGQGTLSFGQSARP
jgi:hypothetical protein